MKPYRIAGLAALSLCGLTNAQAAPTPSVITRDLFPGPRLFLQPSEETSNKTEIRMDGLKSLALIKPYDKAEIKLKKMTIVGPEGKYLFGYHVYMDNKGNPFYPEAKNIYCTTQSPGGITGGDIMLPKNEPIGILNSPWIKTTQDVQRTSSRRELNLRKGLNLVELEIDANNAIMEYVHTNTGGTVKKESMETNNTVFFAIELVTTLEKPDIKLPKQKLPKALPKK